MYNLSVDVAPLEVHLALVPLDVLEPEASQRRGSRYLNTRARTAQRKRTSGRPKKRRGLEWGGGGGGGGGGGVRVCVLDRRDVLIIMHGRSRMIIDRRIPTNAGTERVGFSPTRQTSLFTNREAKREVLSESSRMKGELAASY